MNSQNFVCTIISVLLGGSAPLNAQVCRPGSPGPTPVSEAKPVLEKTPGDTNSSASRKFWLWQNIEFTGGQLTLPFKIRPKADTRSFRLTTDVTVGAYVGITKRLSTTRSFSLTIPLAAGLTFINLNDNNTSLDLALQEAEVVPGLTWCTGLILQLEKYNLGFMLGKDYASEVGNQWMYHRKIWWSFGIGFTFMQGE